MRNCHVNYFSIRVSRLSRQDTLLEMLSQSEIFPQLINQKIIKIKFWAQKLNFEPPTPTRKQQICIICHFSKLFDFKVLQLKMTISMSSFQKYIVQRVFDIPYWWVICTQRGPKRAIRGFRPFWSTFEYKSPIWYIRYPPNYTFLEATH